MCAPEGEIVVAHGCRKREKLICGTEGEIVVANGRLPSPTPSSEYCPFSSGKFLLDPETKGKTGPYGSHFLSFNQS